MVSEALPVEQHRLREAFALVVDAGEVTAGRQRIDMAASENPLAHREDFCVQCYRIVAASRVPVGIREVAECGESARMLRDQDALLVSTDLFQHPDRPCQVCSSACIPQAAA